MAKRHITAEKASTVDQNARTGARVANPTAEQETAATRLVANTFKGTYRTSTALNIREEAKSDARIIGVLNVDTIVSCDGVYALDNGIRYLHITADLDGVSITGYCQVRFLIKQ